MREKYQHYLVPNRIKSSPECVRTAFFISRHRLQKVKEMLVKAALSGLLRFRPWLLPSSLRS